MGKGVRWLVVAVLSLIFSVWSQRPDGDLHVVFCDVGQGDAILILMDDFQMVVDGGPGGEGLMSCLGEYMPFWDRRVEVVLNTHPQKDHLGGLDELLQTYRVDRVIINGVFGGGKDGERLRELIGEKGVEVVLPRANDSLSMGSLQFDILWPQERVGSTMAWSDPLREDLSSEMVLGKNSDVNIVSVVGVLRYGDFEVMLTGDIGFDEEQQLVDSGRLMEVDVLKVAHHGSRYSSSSEFIGLVRPKIAVIQVGENRFGHPTGEVLERLKGVGARVLRTDLNGSVEIVSDGESYWLRY